MSDTERRRHPRFTVVAHVELGAENDEVVMFRVVNISLGGALLALPTTGFNELAAGDNVSAFLDFGSDEAGDNLAVTMEAEVVRVLEDEGRSVAVKWTGGPTRELERILDEIDAESV